jgi:hypothetical protein
VLSEVERMADRVAIVREGRLAEVQTVVVLSAVVLVVTAAAVAGFTRRDLGT